MTDRASAAHARHHLDVSSVGRTSNDATAVMVRASYMMKSTHLSKRFRNFFSIRFGCVEFVQLQLRMLLSLTSKRYGNGSVTTRQRGKIRGKTMVRLW